MTSGIVEEPVINPPRKVRQEQFLENIKKASKVIIDCDFEDLMTDKDLNSMARQLSECYSINRKSDKPFNLIFFDVGERLMTLLVKNNVSNWLGVACVKKGDHNNLREYVYSVTESKEKEEIKKDIIYLTADSDNDINELKSENSYIIGGIVDRNKHKLITFNKAQELGISHGKLPIGDMLQLKSSKVLATNHVFAILSHFTNKQADWKEAFLSIIPKRKFE